MKDIPVNFGKLYIVATPIGNLADISNRAIDVLKNVNYILAEDTRVTAKLLNRFDIDQRLVSFHQHTPEQKYLSVLKDLIDGKNIAFVTDAGTPGVSDPGNELISYLIEKESLIQITAIPGASSLTAALSICGFDTTHVVFVGFMPKKHQKQIYDTVKLSGYALCFYETSGRIIKTLDRMMAEFGEERNVFVGRELTKMYEETYRGSLMEVKLQIEKSVQKGEIVVVLDKGRKM
ncbi:16S rRNA (cytidine(1402)-2'-O)-methyltransferase [Candidatus Woesebacteria bacterium]|nr:MAG: 16S rRNA (cytidine(1402)-2'-O)-methyltransferase [Candidatus Woesebacteria bacterium]